MAFTNVSVPLSKKGAVMVRKEHALDLEFLQTLSESVQELARMQEAAGDELDDVLRSNVSGHYDWRAYLADELEFAMDRIKMDGGPRE